TLGDGRLIRSGGRRVIDDIDNQITRRCRIAILVGDFHREADRGVITIGRFCEGIAVVDTALAGDRIILVAGSQAASGAGGGEGLIGLGQGMPTQADRAESIRRAELDAATGGGAVGNIVRTSGQAGFVYGGTATACRRNIHSRCAVGDADGQFRTGNITIAISNGVGEYVLHATRRTGVALIAVAAVGVDGQPAVVAIDNQVAGTRYGCFGTVVGGDTGHSRT